MEANLEAYLAKKGIEYEKVTRTYKGNYNGANDRIIHYYVLERFVEFDTNFDFMRFTYDKDKLLGIDNFINHLLNELNKNNIKYKEVLQGDENQLFFCIQCEIEDIKFCPNYYSYKAIIEEYEFRKFIKYNTAFEYCRFETIIEVSTNKLGPVEIFKRGGIITLTSNGDDIEFRQFQEFKEWLIENMPEYLKNDDIKIALKD
jgi:hypothetical protein